MLSSKGVHKTISLGRYLQSNMRPTVIRTMTSASDSSKPLEFEMISVTTPKPFVFQVELNRPKKLNAINKQMWMEIKSCFEQLNDNPDCRAVVISSSGDHFSAGIDLNDMMKLGQELGEIDDVARKGIHIGKTLKIYQDGFTALEVCRKPVIAAIHSTCIGAAANMITAADIRYCSEDAWFSVREVQIGMAADVGALQRLPKIIGNQSLVRELCLTGRKVTSKEAFECGLVSKIFPTRAAVINGAIELAEEIASKSPVAVQATKQSLVYSMDHSIQEGLDQIRELNMLRLQSEDFLNAVGAQLAKGEKPVFSKL